MNEELIKERTGKNAEEYLGSLTRFIEKNFTEKNIPYGLGEVLEEKQKEWVRKELIKETMEEIGKIK